MPYRPKTKSLRLRADSDVLAGSQAGLAADAAGNFFYLATCLEEGYGLLGD